jgi:hypothetical protein
VGGRTTSRISSPGADEKAVDPQYFTERVKGFSNAKSITGGSPMKLGDKWKVPGKTIWILELEK